MKTLFLYEEIPERSMFFELEGNYSHLNNVYINMECPDNKTEQEWKGLQDQLNSVLFHPEGHEQAWRLKITEIDQPSKDWDFFVKCGFLL